MSLRGPALALAVALCAPAVLAQQATDPNGGIVTTPLPGPDIGGNTTMDGSSQDGTSQDGTIPGAQGGFVADGTGLGNVTDSSTPGTVSAPTSEKVTEAPKGGVVRWLDKVSGKTVDVPLAPGDSAKEGRLTITLQQCRYPVDDPSSNAYAYLVIHDSQVQDPIFKGWMIASSPALNPLDSPRYDVWLLRCTTS
ncbi:DUF2155 domain-containing protein [Acidimangrovimonas pyrenivorans]|uniref:DUF2155 domain-containing protein n=1 Tax=Acidimangrovimonas pyrenivorans TaxID=2030798 RepID=A0ABV7AI41_9RHOB